MTTYGTIIGVLHQTDESYNIVSVSELCEALNKGRTHCMDEDYFDPTVATDLVPFSYDPFDGDEIDWKQVEKLVMQRNNLIGGVPSEKTTKGTVKIGAGTDFSADLKTSTLKFVGRKPAETLKEGEFAVSEDNSKMYLGMGEGKYEVIMDSVMMPGGSRGLGSVDTPFRVDMTSVQADETSSFINLGKIELSKDNL